MKFSYICKLYPEPAITDAVTVVYAKFKNLDKCHAHIPDERDTVIITNSCTQ